MFPVEPASNAERFKSPLQGLDNVILTPHVGGSTEEAQERIGGEVARKLVDYFITGSTMGAVNFPEVQLHLRPSGARFSHVHRNVPGMLRRLNEVFLQRDINIAAQYLETDGRPRLRRARRRSRRSGFGRAAGADPRARRHGRRKADIRALDTAVTFRLH